MQERIRNVLTGMLNRWNAQDRRMKLTVIGVFIAVIAALFVTIFLTTRPNMTTLFDNLSVSDTAEIRTLLNDRGITNRVVKDGTAIEVREQDVNNAKMELASAGIPKSGFTYTDALNAGGMSSTSDSRRESLLRAKQYELEQAINSFYDVKSASVQLVLPNKDNFFLEDQQRASAGIILDLRSELTKNQILGIARFVANSVNDLELENVSITDSSANPLYYGDIEGLSYFSNQYDMEMKKKNEIESKVKDILSPQYDDVRVISNIKLRWDKTVENSEQYSVPTPDATKGVPQQEIKESSDVTGYADGAEPGMTNNGGTIPQYNTDTGGTASAKVSRSDTTYLYDKVITSRENSVGDIVPEDSSLSIFVANEKHYYQKSLEEQGALNSMSWEDYQTSVKQQKVALTIPPEIISSLQTGTQIKNLTVVGYETPVFHSIQVVERPIDQYAAIIILIILIALLAFALIKRTQPESVTEIEPELSVEELLVSNTAANTAISSTADDEITTATTITEKRRQQQEELEVITTDESETKKQIVKFIDENAEAAAALLRNWLNDDWE